MERLFLQNHTSLLLSLSPVLTGFSGLLVLFSLCFLGVHLTKFAVNGWRLYDEKPRESSPEKPPEHKTETPPPEPIYYIVEKKRRRSKASYGEPKEIRFK